MSTKRVLCKFFMHGACLKGEYCEFSHDWSDQSNNVCTFYQRGSCSYGSRCRYDHVKVSRNNPVPPLPSSSAATVTQLAATIVKYCNTCCIYISTTSKFWTSSSPGTPNKLKQPKATDIYG
ncbi:hypothetical protein ZWY2020_053227 [Hordeum vulgare]|nr:hypothetical protein ZWY2020_053227 [Hordeum vulgare]